MNTTDLVKPAVVTSKYAELASNEVVAKTIETLATRNFHATLLTDGKAALEKIKELIPAGASVMNGTSTTLEQIGLIEHLKSGTHGWNNHHEAILAEKDPAKQGLLRRQLTASDYYLGSVHAITESGELVISSASGSQLPSLAFNSTNLILVVGTQKITSSLATAFERIEKYVIPLEDVRMNKVYGFGTSHNKTLILRNESTAMGRTVHILFVPENLGF
jgi:L-lactate utilization protein LutC